MASGERLGPTVYSSGNWLDGDPPYRSINTVVRTPAEARAVVSRRKKEGYDFIKVYQTLSPAVYREIVRTAQRLGIPVTGRVPSAVGVDGVLATGQAGVDHVAQLLGGDPGEVARRVREANVGVTTTLVMLDRAFAMRGRPEVVESLLALPEARYLSPATRRFWREAPFIRLARADPAMPMYGGAESLERALEAEGVPVMAGTVLNRRVRGADQPGVVREGGRADLLLLEASPLENVAALRRRVGVMARGKWLPQGKLDRKLEDFATGYAEEDSAAASR